MTIIRRLFLFALLTAAAAGAHAQSAGSIAGTVTDANGAVVPGATVSLYGSDASKTKEFVTTAKGEYAFAGIDPGRYSIRVVAKGFGLYENTDVSVTAGKRTNLDVVLEAAEIRENIDVSTVNQLSTDADANKDSTVLKDKEMDALPEDPDELAAALQALVGTQTASGGKIYVDGFTGGQLPSKDSIREIRINSSPFSAEYDTPGNERIEILTKPGADKFKGSVSGAFNDESLNSRNPFAANRAATQQRRFSGNYSGPLRRGRASFYVGASHNSIDNNAIVNAQVLDPAFNIVSFRQDLQVPTTRLSIAPRLDLALNGSNTLTARYGFESAEDKNQGIGDLSLPSRSFTRSTRSYEVRLTETAVIDAKTVNQIRLEFGGSRTASAGDGPLLPTVNVSSSFTSGGATVGDNFTERRIWEINNITSTSIGGDLQHSIKVGAKLRNTRLTDRQENNYAGAFTFGGFTLPVGTTDACDIDGDRAVSAIEQYRCKVQGVGGTRYDPTQFSITIGNPQLTVSQTEWALFVLDDWKVRPDLMVSVGLRYENQTNIRSNLNLAPRISIAWSPGAGASKAPIFVIRAGGGIFYNRFGEGNTLRARLNDGVNQLGLTVSAAEPDPVRRAIAVEILNQAIFTSDGVTNVPTGTQIAAVFPASNTIHQISPILQAPNQIQGVISLEQALLRNKLTLATTLLWSRSLHQIGGRNINAPVCPDFALPGADCTGATRPEPVLGNVILSESSRRTDIKRIGFTVRSNPSLSQRANFSLAYGYGVVRNNSATLAYAFDFSGEYARTNPRHNLNLLGTFNLPYRFVLSPTVNYTSAPPFNITLGLDPNGDNSFLERPTFGALAARCSQLSLTADWCDVSGYDPNATIPRNWGEGHPNLSVSMRLSRTFTFGRAANGKNQDSRTYNLNLGLQVTNLINRVNLGSPVGVMNSNRFGRSTSASGSFGGFGGGTDSGPNRRVELQARLSW